MHVNGNSARPRWLDGVAAHLGHGLLAENDHQTIEKIDFTMKNAKSRVGPHGSRPQSLEWNAVGGRRRIRA
jgi:hypothetical protein